VDPPGAQTGEWVIAMGKLLSLRQAARELGISKTRVRELVEAGVLPGYRAPQGKRFYIPSSALQAMLRGELEAKGNPAGAGGVE